MNIDDPRLTAYALGELPEDEGAKIENFLRSSPQAQQFVQETRDFARLLREECEEEAVAVSEKPANLIDIRDDPWFWSVGRPLALAAALALAALIAALAISTYKRSGDTEVARGWVDLPTWASPNVSPATPAGAPGSF